MDCWVVVVGLDGGVVGRGGDKGEKRSERGGWRSGVGVVGVEAVGWMWRGLVGGHLIGSWN